MLAAILGWISLRFLAREIGEGGGRVAFWFCSSLGSSAADCGGVGGDDHRSPTGIVLDVGADCRAGRRYNRMGKRVIGSASAWQWGWLSSLQIQCAIPNHLLRHIFRAFDACTDSTAKAGTRAGVR